ncbi:MAG: sulfite exporter TauE/SafE family protein [bacterium]|nr:sulfite exporter TauE/SafE family protein [bacterium]
MDYTRLFLLFGVGTIAGFMNVMAGGGSSLTLPALIFLGLDGAMANGTNRVAILLQNVFAVLSFRKRNVHQYGESFKLAVMTLPGAILGAFIAVNISDRWFKKVLSIVLIGIVISMFFAPKKREESATEESKKSWLIYPAMFGIGLYGGFIQAGVGFLFMAALYHILKLNLVHVNMHKVFIIMIYTLPVLAIFVITGKVDWVLGLSLAAGNSFGAWWGAHFAVKGGEKIIRGVLALAILLMALKLLGLF